jgi:hypothetical protein
MYRAVENGASVAVTDRVEKVIATPPEILESSLRRSRSLPCHRP